MDFNVIFTNESRDLRLVKWIQSVGHFKDFTRLHTGEDTKLRRGTTRRARETSTFLGEKNSEVEVNRVHARETRNAWQVLSRVRRVPFVSLGRRVSRAQGLANPSNSSRSKVGVISTFERSVPRYGAYGLIRRRICYLPPFDNISLLAAEISPKPALRVN